MYGNDVRRTLILGQYGTAVRSERNCSENTNVYGVRPITKTFSFQRPTDLADGLLQGKMIDR